MAQLVRTGWFKAVHIKSEESLRLRLLLTHRRTLKRKMLDIENEVRLSVKAFGIRLGSGFSHAAFAKRVRAALAGDAFLLGITECMLRAWAVLWEEHNRLHKLLVKVTLQDELCRRFMAIPGVGPVTALAFKSGVDEPRRFHRSKTVGAHFGLTPRRIQSGDSIDFDGHASCIGDAGPRRPLRSGARALDQREDRPRSCKRGVCASRNAAATSAPPSRSPASWR